VKLTPTFRKSVAVSLILFGGNLAGCSKPAPQEQAQSPAAAPPAGSNVGVDAELDSGR
jgi:hypothetical protein